MFKIFATICFLSIGVNDTTLCFKSEVPIDFKNNIECLVARDDIVNFLDPEQMYKLIGFMIEHEMGSEAFNKYYPPGQRFFLNAMIKEGYEQGINSYGGKLGKLR